MSLIWGLTWIAAKAGISVVPPLFFTSTRFIAAGLLLALWLRATGVALLPPAGLRLRVIAVAGLTVLVSPGLIFWGLARTPSGLGAVVNLTLIPIGLYLIGRAAGEENRSRRLNLALALGTLGLALLFAPRIGGDLAADAWGLTAIVAGTFAYAWGAVIGRPATRGYAAVPMSAATMLIGGTGLLLVSLALERPDAATIAAFGAPVVLAGWLFLLAGGSLVAYTLYLWLLREWGPVRSGLYAFVSPIIAVLAGAVLFEERFGATELAGMAAMLAGTWMALRRRPTFK